MKALLLIDIQNDFLPGGALAVGEGDQVVPVANKLISNLPVELVLATKDWHPPEHGSFAKQHGKNPFEIYSENKKATEENIIDIIEKRQTGKEDLPDIPL